MQGFVVHDTTPSPHMDYIVEYAPTHACPCLQTALRILASIVSARWAGIAAACLPCSHSAHRNQQNTCLMMCLGFFNAHSSQSGSKALRAASLEHRYPSCSTQHSAAGMPHHL